MKFEDFDIKWKKAKLNGKSGLIFIKLKEESYIYAEEYFHNKYYPDVIRFYQYFEHLPFIVADISLNNIDDVQIPWNE